MDFVSLLIFVSVTLISAIYLFFKRKYAYWKERGVPYEEPIFPYGNFKGVARTIGLVDFFERVYYNVRTKDSPFVGIYSLWIPVLFPTDLDLIKNILIKDFHYFTDHGLYSNQRDDPLSAHLFMLDGDEWRSMRNKLSPLFTSGKIKGMFGTMKSVGEEFAEAVNEVLKTQNVLEMKDLMERYTTNVIGSCAFGIDCDCFKDPNSEFRTNGRKLFSEHRYNQFIEGLILIFPDIARKLRLKLLPDKVSGFFMRIVKDTIEYREKHNIKRNDFMDILLQLKKDSNVNKDNENDGRLTIEQIAAQLLIFFVAGFETSSALMSFCVYELALNSNIQDKLRAEINEVLTKHNGNVTYEVINEMSYMNQVINETLRKYPPSTNLIRKTVQDYKIPNTDLVIEKGTMILVPVYSIHNDPEIYDDPQVFDPERFSPENIKSRHSAAFLPFGDGPRNCIGLRFGLLQARVGLLFLLKNFRFINTPSNQNPLEFDVKAPLLNSKHGIYLKIEKV